MGKLKGYAGLAENLGIFVQEEDAFQYAMERVQWSEELQKEFVEWFYSGNWVPEEREGE